MSKDKIAYDTLEFEREEQLSGYSLIAGMDEVGRGPLAGPVVVACVIMNLENIIPEVTDSKKLSEKKREALYPQILDNALCVSIAEVSEKVIDEINILQATKLAMKNAVEGLKIKPDVVLIDAVKLDIPYKTVSIIKGDLRSYSIACASIVAKVYRDKMMVDLSNKYPEYGFEKHKGYGTKDHIDALAKYGACDIHRKTFITKFVK